MLNAYQKAAAAGAFLAVSVSSGALQAQYSGPVALAQHQETVAAAPPPVTDNQVLASINAGAVINSGNTDSYQGSVGGRLKVVRHPHLLSVDVLGTMGAVKNLEDGPYEKTSANVYGRFRYDAFLSKDDALFLALQPRRDTFAGLNMRLQMQAGYMRNLFNPNADHRFWAEAGYDLTYDDFAVVTTTSVTPISQQDLVTAGLTPEQATAVLGGGSVNRTVTNTSDPGHDFVNSARAFLGYTNTLSPAANLNLGVEALFDVQDASNVRVNALADITTSVTQAFKLGVLSRLFYDHVPVPDKKRADLVLSVNLIYTYDSLAGAKKKPECPACDCASEVEAAKASCDVAAPAGEPSIVQPTVAPAAPNTPPAAVAPETAPVPAPEAAPAAPAPAAPVPATP
jgi:putative salt-induced outer membrane protein YdiY